MRTRSGWGLRGGRARGNAGLYTLLGLPLFDATAERVEEAAHAQLERLDRYLLHPVNGRGKLVN